ncbi:MAG: serine/threonine protein phosphatase PrpC [Woeseiaceae bacterium]|jgi:serine/threonine protein phosphatase PrpC
MSNTDDDILFINGASSAGEMDVSVGGGSMFAYTCPAPDKTTENEDSVAAIPYGPDAVVLVVADGAGGLPAGRRASQTAIRSLQESLQGAMEETMLLRTAILNGIEAANQSVLNLANGSATTMTVVTVEGLIVRTYQVGDSEALIVGQRGRIRSQTMAHSPTGFAVEAGFLDQRAALHHEERHLVSNFIGASDMRIDMGAEIRLNPRDTILVASDGLTDNIHLHEITEIIRKGSLANAIEAMTGLAKRRMTVETLHQPSKPDDFSVILYRKPFRRLVKSAPAS